MRGKFIVLFILFLGFFTNTHFASANVVFNEIQLNPTGERFIELYNSGNTAISLTDWYIQRKTASGSDFGSLVSKTYFEGKSIKAGGYFVISRNNIPNTDIVYSSLTLTESNTIQIKNSEGNVVDKISWGNTNDCSSSCAPNPTDGQSIQQTSSGSWVIALHTPGAPNEFSNNSNDNLTDSTNNSKNDTETKVATKPKVVEIPKITTEIISKNIAVAGIPFKINSKTTGLSKETIVIGKYVWNFGDGTSQEDNQVKQFEHVYEYPGEYLLSLEYSQFSSLQGPDAVDRMIIKVIPSLVSISSVGSFSDPFIEIENKSDYEINISGWILKANNKFWIAPRGMVVLPSKKIRFSPKITGFTFADLSKVDLMHPDGENVSTYPMTISKSAKVIKSVSPYIESKVTQPETIPSNIIDLNNLSASASDAKGKQSGSTYFILSLIGVIILGIISFLYARNTLSKKTDIEARLSADDIKILE